MPPSPASPLQVIDRLDAALNAHDLDAFAACFAPDYHSEQPAHPDRTFDGREQVRKNWSSIFKNFPDFRSQRLQDAVARHTVWTEWDWSGTHTDGSRLHMRGVTLFGIRDDQLAWGRLYMEGVEQAGAAIDAAVQQMVKGSQPPE